MRIDFSFFFVANACYFRTAKGFHFTGFFLSSKNLGGIKNPHEFKCLTD